MNEDRKGNFAEVNSLKMYYEIYDTGRPLILLHGGVSVHLCGAGPFWFGPEEVARARLIELVAQKVLLPLQRGRTR